MYAIIPFILFKVNLVLVASMIGHDRFDHVMGNINTLHKVGEHVSMCSSIKSCWHVKLDKTNTTRTPFAH